MFDTHVCISASTVSEPVVCMTFYTPDACSLAALHRIGKYEGDFIVQQAFGEGRCHAVQQNSDG